MPDPTPDIDLTRVKRESLERLAFTLLGGVSQLSDYEEQLEAVRAEAAPPKRTRAEVDAEIATVVRMAFGAGSVQVRSGAVNMTSRLEELCDEPTAATAEPFHHRVSEALGLMDGDMGRYLYADEERCLKEIRDNRQNAESWREHQAATAEDPLFDGIVDAEPAELLERVSLVVRAWRACAGPTGKHDALQKIERLLGLAHQCCCGAGFATPHERLVHWETCAVFLGKEEDPELPDPAPCSCDEALALRATLDRIRALAKPVAGSSSIPTRAERTLQEILAVLE